MKYFAKYLPVEGEIKIGDKFFNKDNNQIQTADDDQVQEGVEYWGENLYRKAKLFLCSKDIQVGDSVKWIHDLSQPEDKVLDETLYHWWTDHGVDKKDRFFKVLGEISPNATWVVENQEFDEEEIVGLVALPYYDFDVDKLGYLIKGPCGHFH